ncbi:fibronectin type III domain-containing protein [uncultured Streptomyces sp.]|uniref:fibronectin type III domain-containing protein n=1 Tax=uncultured Streptomyces sp. TaxID=174707 RepID=UPI002606BECA|nr:fibronectin type III domain-containing protein [uncultured Streptomyces sp.]
MQRPPTHVTLACAAALLLTPIATACGGPAGAHADTRKPTVPRDVTAQAGSATSVHVMWDAATDDKAVTAYEIYRATAAADGTTAATPAPAAKVKTIPGSKHMTDVEGLTASTAYTFTVRARDAAGNLSAPSAAVTATTPDAPRDDRAAPTAPTAPRATGVGPRTATLTWGRSTDDVGVTAYDVYQEDVRIHSVPGTRTTATLAGLRPGTVYSFTVRARDAADTSSPDSAVLDVTTESATGAPAATAPTGLRTTVRAEGGAFVVGLSWDQPETGGTIPAYELYLDGKPTTTIVWGGTPPKGRAGYELTLTEPAGARHSVKLRAKLPDGTWGDFSAQRTVELKG